MDILKILKQGESETVEYKLGFNKEAIETVVAFSNTRGGVIIIGVNNDGEVKGVKIGTETLKDWGNQISQNTEPKVIPDIRMVEVKHKVVAIIEIKEFPLKPVSTRGRSLRRVQNSNRQMSPQEIAHMHLASTGSSWDALSAENVSLNDLDLTKVQEFIISATATGRKNFGHTPDPIGILEKLELVKSGVPTWASVLIFGKTPQSPLTQAQVHCGRFKSNIDILDDKLFDGTIVDQVDKTMEFIQKHINVRFHITGKSRREEIWEYPLEALREAVVNAICHRDYSDTADIQIKIFDDSVQIWNPGPLPYGITIEDIYRGNHSSRPRNKLVAQVFYDLGLIERYGSGIERMINACKVSGLPEPAFDEINNGFRVILKKSIQQGGQFDGLEINDRQQRACQYINKKGKITNREYREINNVKPRLALSELQDMVDKSILAQVGTTGRGTYYIFK